MAYLMKPGMRQFPNDVLGPGQIQQPYGGRPNNMPFGPGHPLYDPPPMYGGQQQRPMFGTPYRPPPMTNAAQRPGIYSQLAMMRRPRRLGMGGRMRLPPMPPMGIDPRVI